ncbi:hypothetical protein CJF32_00002969 [Rutstroemia sp. NJR-2017a WRK4]|nr:hypothetical protein CJF32_00002969 [Rutstroemia sp. NJR-2017a WRK4]
MTTEPGSARPLFPPVRGPPQWVPPPPRDPPEPALIPDNSSPSTDWLPIYNKRTPYVEAEIVHLIHEIVRHFAQLSPISEDDVIWPPEGGHHLDEAVCAELNISDEAKSLIRLLPCPGPKCIPQICLYEFSRILDIAEDGGLRDSRQSPSCFDDTAPPGERYILPYEVQLSKGDRDTPSIILDTRENTIRIVYMMESADDLNPPDIPLERPDDPDHYRNYWPRHAPTWLRRQLNRIKALDIIPPGPDELSYVDSSSEWLRRKIKHSLEGTYGWPDDFQQSAWDEDCGRLWDEANEEFERLGGPNVLKFN